MGLLSRHTRADVLAVACGLFLALALRSPWASGLYEGPAGAALTGSIAGVVRTQDKQAIAQARVCATCTTCAPGDEAVACVTSDGAGRYEIAELRYGRYWIAASADGYAATAARGAGVHVASQRVLGTDIDLPRGGSRIAGSVRDAMGVPVANARVRVTHADPPRYALDVLSDASGAFVLAMPDGSFEIAAHAKGYAPVSSHGVAPAQRIRLTLEPAFALQGRVVDANGEPIAGVNVRAVPRDRMPRLAWSQSDAGGHFRFSSLPAGSYVFMASGAGVYGELPDVVELGDESAAVEPIAIAAHRAFALRGRVQLEDGAPCPEGYVLLGEPDPAQPSTLAHAELEQSDRTIGPEQHAIIERDGTVHFGGVPAARYFAAVYCDGYALQRGPAVVELPRDAQRELTWVMQPATKLRARVVDARGRPAAHARIAISWPGRDRRRAVMPALAGADGSAEISGPRCGDCQLMAGDNVGRSTAVPFVISERGAHGAATLALEGDTTLELEVRDHEGAPLDGLQVIARRADGVARRYVAVALGDGRYRFSAVPAGAYSITGDDGLNPAEPLWGTAAMPVEVPAGASLHWRTELSRIAVLSGRVLDEAGRPARGAWVSAQAEVDPENQPLVSMMSGTARRVMTDREGRFAIDRLVAGARFAVRAWRVAGGEALLDARAPQQGVELRLEPR
jgi:protocatechuate 3,4-dioxygenase beta subunit